MVTGATRTGSISNIRVRSPEEVQELLYKNGFDLKTNQAVPKASAPAATPAPSIQYDGYSDDATWLDQSAAIQRANADYAANLQRNQQYATMGYDNAVTDVNRESEKNQLGLIDDYAGRGMLNSGLYAKGEDERAAGVQRQKTALAQQLQQQLNQYNTDATNYNSEQTITGNRAKADAVARAAAKYTIG